MNLNRLFNLIIYTLIGAIFCLLFLWALNEFGHIVFWTFAGIAGALALWFLCVTFLGSIQSITSTPSTPMPVVPLVPLDPSVPWPSELNDASASWVTSVPSPCSPCLRGESGFVPSLEEVRAK